MSKAPSGKRPVQRHVEQRASELIDAFRVVVINGPRQSGKSTLLRALQKSRPGPFFNLDSEEMLAAVRSDPVGLVRTDSRFLYIDEVQLGRDALVRAIKARVDDPENETTYVLAGSTNFLTVPVIAESLAGRAIFVDVWPFSQGELRETRDGFLDFLVSGRDLTEPAYPELSRSEYLSLVVRGGYPEPLRLTPLLRAAWFESYIRTVVNRDIVEIARVRKASDVERLLTYLTGKTGQELVKARLANDVALDRNLLANYTSLLETVFLVKELPAWSRNPLGKVRRAPKIHACDSGLAAHLHGVTEESIARPVAPLRGALLETFVYNEILKQRSWSTELFTLSHWRDRDDAEVDLILETRAGLAFCLEVKASATVSIEDFRWLKRLSQKLGDDFAQGIVFYLGTRALSFGPKLVALPISALWTEVGDDRGFDAGSQRDS